MADLSWEAEVQKVYYPGEDRPHVHVRRIDVGEPEVTHLPGECPVHGIQTFVWNEGARWWHCPDMYVVGFDPAVGGEGTYVQAPVCHSVVPHEDYTPDGYEVVWYAKTPPPEENP